jgi:hypothetical protein
MLLEFCLLSLFSLTLFFLQFPFALCVSFIFLVSLVFSSSFLICFARQHHHLVFFLLLVMWHDLSTLTWIWSPPTGGSWWSQLGCYSSWGLPYILQFQVSGHACDCQLFYKHSSGFLFFQNLSMLRLGFLLSCLLICSPDQTFYNLYIIRSYFQFFSGLIKFVSMKKFCVLMDI